MHCILRLLKLLVTRLRVSLRPDSCRIVVVLNHALSLRFHDFEYNLICFGCVFHMSEPTL